MYMKDSLQTIDLEINDLNEARALFGTNDVFLKRIEKELNVSIITRGEKIQVFGDSSNQIQEILNQLLVVIQEGITITERDVVYVIKLAIEGKTNQFASLFADVITT